jgi:hypothetical protein
MTMYMLHLQNPSTVYAVSGRIFSAKTCCVTPSLISPGPQKNLVIPAKPDTEIDLKDIELSVIDVYDAYRTLIAKQPEGKTAVIRREHAVMSLICGKSLCNGFIGKYAVRFDRTDVKMARELIKKAETREFYGKGNLQDARYMFTCDTFYKDRRRTHN